MHLQEIDTYERVTLTETTRRLLCSFAAADFSKPLNYQGVDWSELFQGIGRNGLLALVHDYLKKGRSRDKIPTNFKNWVQESHRNNAIRLILMYMKVTKVLTMLNESEIEYMVVKGPALAHLIYPDPTARSFNDLDIVIRERDWAAMHRLLIRSGFIPELNLPDPPPKIIPEAVSYELKYWHVESKLLVEVHYDDLLNAGLAAREIERFWQRAITIEVDGIPIKTLSLEDHLIHLCMHAHYHGYTRLNWFSDIGILLKHHGHKLNWEQFLETIRIEEAEVGVYYSLYFLEKLLGISAPPEIMDALRPDPFRRWWHQYYLPEKQVLSLEPMYHPDFSFYFRPLLKRFIPDLLVMGRRPEKFRYMIRLLAPPQEWLRYYYRLTDDESIWPHYLLHPLKLIFHYSYELISKLLPLRQSNG